MSKMYVSRFTSVGAFVLKCVFVSAFGFTLFYFLGSALAQTPPNPGDKVSNASVTVLQWIQFNLWWVLLIDTALAKTLKIILQRFFRGTRTTTAKNVILTIIDLLDLLKTSNPGQVMTKPMDVSKVGMLLVVGLFAVSAVSCGSCNQAALKSLDISGKTIAKGWSTYYPKWSEACKKKALACRKDGVRLTLKDCPKAKTCLEGLKEFNDVLTRGDQAIMIATPLAAEGKPGADAWVAAAAQFAGVATQVLQKYGIIPKTAGGLITSILTPASSPTN